MVVQDLQSDAVMVLRGHTAPITNVQLFGTRVLSSAYDRYAKPY